MMKLPLNTIARCGCIGTAALVLILSACIPLEEGGSNDDNAQTEQNADDNRDDNTEPPSTPDDCQEAGEFPTRIDEDTTIDVDCYMVSDVVEVNDGTLTLQPGTTLVFTENAGVRVHSDAALDASGTDDDPIWMLGEEAEPGHWRGIHFSGTDSTENALRHTYVGDAGGHNWSVAHNRGPANVVIRRARVELKEVTLENSADAGLWMNNDTNVTMYGSSVFTDNQGPPVSTTPESLGHLNSESDYSGNHNEESAIRIRGGDVDQDVQWDQFNVPVIVDTVLDIEDSILEISPGNDFLFTSGSGLRVNSSGRLSAEGTKEEPITMYGKEAVPGYWRGVFFSGSDSLDNAMHHVKIADAGGHNWTVAHTRGPANLVINNSRVDLHELTLTHSEEAGLWLRNTRDVSMSGESIITDNDGPPVSGSSQTIGSLNSETDYTGNRGNHDAIEIRGGSISNDAEWDWVNVPILVDTVIDVEDGLLEVAAGNELLFTQGSGLRIDGPGRLSMVGTESDPIMLAGDEPIAGLWRGVFFTGSFSGDNHLEHVEIHDGGGHNWTVAHSRGPANLVLTSSYVTANDLTVTHSGGDYGISLHSDSQFDCHNVTNDGGWNVTPPC